MSNASKARATLKKLKKKGAPCTLLKPDGDAIYDESSDQTIQPTISHEGYCLVSSFNSALLDSGLVQNENVLSTDVKLLCSFIDGAEPEDGKDVIVVNPGTEEEQRFNVVNGKKLALDGKRAILITVRGRK